MEPFGSLKYKSSWMFHDFLELLLPFKNTSQERQKPMQVLALGLNRCGTDSLRIALEELGYTRCYQYDIYLSAYELDHADNRCLSQWLRLPNGITA